MTEHNSNCLQKTHAKESWRHNSPYYRAFSRSPRDYLVPFGTGAYVRVDAAKGEKFAPRATPHAVVGYGPHGSYKLLDLDRLQKGKVKIRTSLDVRITPNEYPARALKLHKKMDVTPDMEIEENPTICPAFAQPKLGGRAANTSATNAEGDANCTEAGAFLE